MYIGDFIKQYREFNGVSIEDFANKAGLTTTEIEVLEKNVQDGWYCSTRSNAPNQRYCSRYGCTYAYSHGTDPSDQELVVHVVAESDQPHAK